MRGTCTQYAAFLSRKSVNNTPNLDVCLCACRSALSSSRESLVSSPTHAPDTCSTPCQSARRSSTVVMASLARPVPASYNGTPHGNNPCDADKRWCGANLVDPKVQTTGPYHSRSATGLYTWQEVLWHVRSAGHVLSRSTETEVDYKAHRKRVRSSGQTLADNVLSYFTVGVVAFTPALFPYALPPEVRHWILWVRQTSYDAWRRHVGPAAELRQQVRRVYGKRAAGAIAFVQNLEGERSIAAVPHYHVFVVNSSVRSPEHSTVASRCVARNDSVRSVAMARTRPASLP